MTKFFDDKSYAENSRQQLWLQRETDPFCDVVLIAVADRKRIPAHRCILSAASEYFNKRFTYEMESKEIKMSDVESDTLNSTIEYCYTGCVEIKEEDVVDLLQAADMLLLPNVAKACLNFMKEHLHPTNCLSFTLLAERYNCPTLLERAKEYTADYFMDVYETAEFLQSSRVQLGELLERVDLRVPHEEHIFNSVMNWIEHDRIERAQYKDELLKLVRMPLLESTFLNDIVKPICTSTVSLELYAKAMEWQSLSECSKLISGEILKPRASYEHLMGITLNKESSKMFLHFYCPQQLKWIKLLNQLVYRTDFGLAIMEQQLYIVGGCDVRLKALNTVICVNLKTMTITQVSSMREYRERCTAAVLNGFLYVASGYQRDRSVERYNPKNNTWRKVAPFNQSVVSRGFFGLIAVNNKLYVIGGYEPNLSESYDSHKDEWTSIASLNYPCLNMVNIVARNGLIYALEAYRTKVERYDTVRNQWTTLCSLHEPLRTANLCTVFQDKVIVCYDNRCDVYNGTINEWNADHSLKGLPDIYCVFSYSEQLLKSVFAEN